MQEFLDATASCGSPYRNATTLAAVKAGIKAGVFSWHAKPFTMIHELCDPDIYSWSLSIAKKLNARFNVSHGTVVGKITGTRAPLHCLHVACHINVLLFCAPNCHRDVARTLIVAFGPWPASHSLAIVS